FNSCNWQRVPIHPSLSLDTSRKKGLLPAQRLSNTSLMPSFILKVNVIIPTACCVASRTVLEQPTRSAYLRCMEMVWPKFPTHLRCFSPIALQVQLAPLLL